MRDNIIVPAFLNPSTQVSLIDDLGVQLMRIIFGKKPDIIIPLATPRYNGYIKQCSKGKLRPERLPPSKAATVVLFSTHAEYITSFVGGSSWTVDTEL